MTVNKYMAACVPGAEEILKDEINTLIPGNNSVYSERGKVFFCCDLELHDLLRLRCADNIYRVLNRFNIGPHKKDLTQFYKNIARTDLTGLDELFIGAGLVSAQQTGERVTARVTPTKKQMSVIVSASRSGKHTYSRYDLSDTATEALLSTGKFTAGNEANHVLAFRIDVKDDVCLFSVQLTSAEFRFRGENFYSSRGGIRPTVAHCLVRVSQPKNNDVFYDPFCGAGTIAYERSSYKYKKIFASDIDIEAMNTARRNLSKDIILFQEDALKTRIKSNSIDSVVTNMPWGKQIKSDDLPGLYDGFIKELKRILKADGKAGILTDQNDLLYKACDISGFKLDCAAELSLHGLHPKIYILTKKR